MLFDRLEVREEVVMAGIPQRYAGKIGGVLSCFDRVVIRTIPQIGYADAMSAELWRRKIRIFDFPRWEHDNTEFDERMKGRAKSVEVETEICAKASRGHLARSVRILSDRG